MLPTEDLFVHLYVLVDDTVADGAVAIPPRPGPVPACPDAEVLTVALGSAPARPPLRGRLAGRGPPRLGLPAGSVPSAQKAHSGAGLAPTQPLMIAAHPKTIR